MQAIKFMVRDDAGRLSSGQLQAIDGKLVFPTDGLTDVSINIGRDDIRNYVRVGNDLVITLEDGQEVVISNLFVTDGGQSVRLYFSEGGQIHEVSFTESWGRTNHAHWGNTEGVDGLVFNESSAFGQASGAAQYEMAAAADASMGAGYSGAVGTETITTYTLDGNLVGAGAGGLGLLGLLFNGASAAAGVSFPGVANEIRILGATTGADATVNADEMAAGVVINGDTDPNKEVTVTVTDENNAVYTAVTTANDQGEWSVTFASGTLPGGEYTAKVVATTIADEGTDGAEGGMLLAEMSLPIDTLTNVDVDVDVIEGDGVVNAVESADGVTMVGTTQPGSVVSVTFQGITLPATVTADGSWHVTFNSASVAGLDDVMVTVVAEAVDAAGNIATDTQVVRVDVVNTVDFDTNQVGDNIINETESQNDVTFTGQTAPGSTVTVEIDGTIIDASVAADGTWTVVFTPEEIPAGSSVTLLATSEDALGNVATSTHVVQIDTAGFVQISDANVEIDDVINMNESLDGVVITGTTLAGSTVTVQFQGFTGEANVDDNGNWSIDVPASAIAEGTYDVTVHATAVSASGNVSTDTEMMRVDTLVDALSITDGVVAGNNVINSTEYDGGVTVSGVVEAGSTVVVSIHEATQTATVDDLGNWTVDFAAGAFEDGDYVTQVVVNVTDAAGNERQISQTVLVDTIGATISLNPVPLGDDGVLNAVEVNDGLVLTGSSDPGVEVTVDFNGRTHTAVTDADGNWVITLSPDDIGSGTGVLPLTVRTVDANGNIDLVTTEVGIDTEISNVSFPSSAIAVDGIINDAEIGSSVSINGTAEVGATVVVSINSDSFIVPVDPSGNWSLVLDGYTFDPGEYLADVTAVITDLAGNSITESTTVAIDTLVSNLAVTSTSMDGSAVLNSFVAQTGINLTGTVEPNATIMVEFAGTTKAATVDQFGNWSITFSGDEVPIGEYTTTAIITATDVAGNTSSVTSDFVIDTAIPDAPEITAITEDAMGILRSIGMPYSEDSFTINAVNETATGSVNVPAQVFHDTFRNELLFNFNQEVSEGTDLIVELNDSAGNVTSTLFVMDDNADVNMGASVYDNFDIQAIDLAFSEDASLTITSDQLEAMSVYSDNILIRGEATDTVVAIGAQNANEVREIDGVNYNIYTLGDNGAYMVIDQDITVVT